MRGYQCLKQIHLTVHHPELEAPIAPDTQSRFDEGHLVGEKAREHFGGGVLVDNKPWDFVGSLKRTRELLKAQTPIIYEAAFEHNGCYARADVIRYLPDLQRWQVYEVKSSTSIKDEHLQDVALQAWIMAKGGLPIAEIHLVHLNSQCKFPDLSNLFVINDVTDECRHIYPGITGRVNDIWQTIRSEHVPSTKVGPHCSQPYSCGFTQHCFSEAGIPEFSILNLPELRAKKWELLESGVREITDPQLATLTKLSELQQRVIEVERTGNRYFDKVRVQAELEKWQFPLVFLDFETLQSAIPRFGGCWPYAQVPFQFSAHVLRSWSDEPQHFEFLWEEDSDPRPALIPELLKICEGEGHVVAFYQQFESERIKEMAVTFPQYSEALLALLPRFVDPLPILRQFVYDKKFRASFSLKSVAPALLGEASSYEGMTVADGRAAQRAYAQMLKCAGEEKRKLHSALLEYCRKDTQVMLELVLQLRHLAQS